MEKQFVGFKLGQFGFHASGKDVAELLKTSLYKVAVPLIITAGGTALVWYGAKYGSQWLFNWGSSKQSKQNSNVTSNNSTDKKDATHYDPSYRNAAELVNSRDTLQEVPLIKDVINVGEIHILAGDTNIGKSFFGLQYAFKFASGKPSPIIPNDCVCEPMKVLYYDGEHSDAEFVRRCNAVDHVTLANITRISNCGFSEAIDFMDDVEKRVSEIDGDVVVEADNMFSLFETLSNKQASALLNRIKQLRANATRKITFVFIAHLVKDYDPYSPIWRKDIGGSVYFTQMADSISAIAQTRHGEGVTMLKRVKIRSEGADKSIVFIEKMIDDPYPHPEYLRTENEIDALPVKPKNIQTKQQSSGQNKETSSSDLLKEIEDFYQPHVDGHGLSSVVKKYGKQMGWKQSTQAQRFLKKHCPHKFET